MTPRERDLETLLFGTPDKIPLSPGGPRQKTLRRWRTEGLPEGADHVRALHEALGIDMPEPSGDPRPDVAFGMIPTFEEKVLEHRSGHYIVQDWMGAVTEISDEYDYTYIRSARDFVTRKWHSFPVRCRADFDEKIRPRYDPDAPERFPADFDERCRALEHATGVVSIGFRGPFWQLREWCGFEGLCTFMIDDPEFVDEMVEFWVEFTLAVMRKALTRLAIDRLRLSEDMAYKAHCMISPDMVRRFLMPAYEQWIPEARSGGCKIVDMDSDGYVGELVPLWIESGINVCDPMEVAAGNDIVAYRERYGRDMAYTGGIDKRAIAAGGDTMRNEVLRVVPPLLKHGGYIPKCDHAVPHDVSWPDYVEYSRLLAELTGWL